MKPSHGDGGRHCFYTHLEKDKHVWKFYTDGSVDCCGSGNYLYRWKLTGDTVTVFYLENSRSYFNNYKPDISKEIADAYKKYISDLIVE